MKQTLEERLLKYEKDKAITNDEELTKALEYIIKSEESLPASKRDYDLIDEAVDALINLSGIDTSELNRRAAALAEDHISRVKAQHSENGRAKLIHLKKIIPLAALFVFALVISLVVSANKSQEQKDHFYNYESLFNESVDINSSGEYFEYGSLDELCSDLAMSDLVKPYVVPDGYSEGSISVQRSCWEAGNGLLIDYTLLEVVMMSEEGTLRITVEAPSFDFTAEGAGILMGDKTVYLQGRDGAYHAKLMISGQTVDIRSPSLNALKTVVLNMK